MTGDFSPGIVCIAFWEMGYVPQVWWCGGSALFSLVLLLSPQMHQYSMGPHGCVAGLPAMGAGLNLGIA